MKRLFVLMYGLACYVLFLGVFVYAVGFVGGFLTPTRLDASIEHPDTATFVTALLIDALTRHKGSMVRIKPYQSSREDLSDDHGVDFLQW